MQIYFPFFRIYLEEVFARWTSAAVDRCVWSRQSFEVCHLQTWVCSRIGQGRSVLWSIFTGTPCVIAGRHWEYEGTISGVTSSNCMLIVGAAPRDAPLTQERSPGKKSVGFFFSFFFVLRSGEEEENSCFTSSRQPVDHILANHAACCICDTLSCGDFCSRRRQRCWQSPEVIWEQQDSGAQLQRLPRFFWAWQGLREWQQRAAEAVFLRHAIALMLFWWERGIVVNEMAVWPGGTGRFFYLQHAQKLKKPNPPKVPGSVLCVGGNAVKQQNTELFSNYFPPDGNTSVILSQGNPVFPQQLLQ